MNSLTPFHLAIAVDDLDAASAFYRNILDCKPGRSSSSWIDFDFFGHQLVCHKVQALHSRVENQTNSVDAHDVPVPHFGIVLEMSDWMQLKQKIRKIGYEFRLEPHIRFQGEAGEQGTFFIDDPAGNCIEIKGFADIKQNLFKTSK